MFTTAVFIKAKAIVVAAVCNCVLMHDISGNLKTAEAELQLSISLRWVLMPKSPKSWKLCRLSRQWLFALLC